MAGYVKVNGVYREIDSTFVKVNGEYRNVIDGFVKVNGTYQNWFDSSGGGGNPVDDLNSIDILNTEMFGGSKVSEKGNIWGRGDGKDASGNSITRTIGSIYGYFTVDSFTVTFPWYKPVLNVTDTWLAEKGIVIAGSTASITKKVMIKKSSNKNEDYQLIYDNSFDNIRLSLNNNEFAVWSNEKPYRVTGDGFYISSSDNYNINRLISNKAGLQVRVEEEIVGGGTILSYHEWRWEIDVLYSLTFTHVESGEVRTIQKTIKYRTYN